ncbi:MAG: sugar phosphate nucleotidyltransferase [Verrucomicrobiaceae bacterium]
MNKAFVLGAGLGTRLRPLTDQLPKPLIPVLRRPLITHAFDHLRNSGMSEFIVNTHHLPGKYAEAFPDSTFKGSPITFRHEPVLLETAGGIANIADLVGNEPFLVYNGDILTDLPLLPLMQEHERTGRLVTLALRSRGPARHIAFDSSSGRITDIRNKLATGCSGTHQFTGIYAVSAGFLKHLTPGKIESVIPVFLKLIANGGSIGGIVLDQGNWRDLGDRENYLEAHQELLKGDSNFDPISPAARIHPTARLLGATVVGDNAEIGADAVLEDCILWPEARVADGADLKSCIVRSGMTARGTLRNADV